MIIIYTTITRISIALFATLLITTSLGSSRVSAKEFDVTGTIDCRVLSGEKCRFPDWETGPIMTVISDDLSGVPQPVSVDTSWVREDLTDFDQDDFVWFVVEEIGANLQVTSVLEHRCMDGRVAHGSVNDGRFSGTQCHSEARSSD